ARRLGWVATGERWRVDTRFALTRYEIKIGATRRPGSLDDPFGDGLDGRMDRHVALQWRSNRPLATASTRPIGTSDEGPAFKARSTTARFSAPDNVSMIMRADRIAARLKVTRATGASGGKGSGMTPIALRLLGLSSASSRSGP